MPWFELLAYLQSIGDSVIVPRWPERLEPGFVVETVKGWRYVASYEGREANGVPKVRWNRI